MTNDNQVLVFTKVFEGLAAATIIYAIFVSIGKKLFAENIDQFVGYLMSITGFGIVAGKYVSDALYEDINETRKLVYVLGGMFLFLAIVEVYVFKEQDLHQTKSEKHAS